MAKWLTCVSGAPQLENIAYHGGIGGVKNILRGENVRLREQKYTKYNKINNDSENFRECKIASRGTCLLPLGFAPWPPSLAGLRVSCV